MGGFIELKKVFTPTSKKLLIGLILFAVLPTIVLFEEQNCEPGYSFYLDTKIECTSNSGTVFVPFFGIVWLFTVIFEFGTFTQMLPSFIIQVILSFVLGCLMAVYVLKEKKETEKAKEEKISVKEKKQF